MGTFRYPGSGFSFREYFPPGVKWLLIANCILFVIFFFVGVADTELARTALGILGLRASGFFRGMFWQPVTYMFLHDPTGFGHIVFNMLTLWMFGADLEREWGLERFLKYYLVCGVGAGLCDVVANVALRSESIPTIGASGAIYGILLAFGLLYPHRTVYFSFLFPIPARIFVLIMGVIAFMSSFNRQSAVSNIAHLGGMLFGFLYLRFRLHGVDASSVVSWFSWYQRWRRRRMRQKFEVYMRKKERSRDHNRWVQ